MDGTKRPNIVVIGAGLSAAALVHALLRRAKASFDVSVYKRSHLGEGAAYGTGHPLHLLNVRASAMSLVHDDPDHFVRWLSGTGRDHTKRWGADPDPDGFLPRGLYAEYVADALGKAGEGAIDRVAVDAGHGAALGLAREHGSWIVSGEDGDGMAGDQVVLALGIGPPSHPIGADLPVYQSPRYARDPWSSEALMDLDRAASVLVIGTGLTMIDLAITLDDRKHRGTIHAVSRHGLVPLPHASYQPLKAPWDSARTPTTARAALRALRAPSGEWRAVVDSIRGVSSAVWAAWPEAERRRFLRHVRPLWDVHRHRAAPQILERIDRMRAEERLVVEAGRVTGLALRSEGVIATIAGRAGGARTRTFERVINATGPEADYRRWDDPLVRSLFERGWIRPGPLGLGLDATTEGAILDRSGCITPSLWTLGPTLRGALWETTAVPEIRGQAARLADRLLASLETKGA